jgi:hypothetical protein
VAGSDEVMPDGAIAHQGHMRPEPEVTRLARVIHAGRDALVLQTGTLNSHAFRVAEIIEEGGQAMRHSRRRTHGRRGRQC